MTDAILYIILGLLAAVILLLLVLLARKNVGPRDLDAFGKLMEERQTHATAVQEQAFKYFNEKQESGSAHEIGMIKEMQDGVANQLELIYKRMQSLENANQESLERIRNSLTESTRELREENSRKLDEMRGVVDEKLQSTLETRISESFKQVSEQLARVYEGLGEMQTLANDVGGLKKVLSGVKTRGILGEIQLGAILEEILAPEQYETNVATIPGSNERVEYAVRLPGGDGDSVYLPIDSKFPAERYSQLLAAQESGDKELIDKTFKALETEIKKGAGDIRSKYVQVPYTTNFGILFLPFEGLYAEVVNRGLIEPLQREFNINVAGPSTMAALLNSLQMGFRTLALQKKSAEVWKTLAEVKSEFDKFEEIMRIMRKNLNQTSKNLDDLMGTRTRAIQRKLQDVQRLDEAETYEYEELPDLTEEY